MHSSNVSDGVISSGLASERCVEQWWCAWYRGTAGSYLWQCRVGLAHRSVRPCKIATNAWLLGPEYLDVVSWPGIDFYYEVRSVCNGERQFRYVYRWGLYWCQIRVLISIVLITNLCIDEACIDYRSVYWWVIYWMQVRVLMSHIYRQ